ncbi:phage integrase central domain-containing protein [Variovorax sp. Root411]|uniref:phage integrase central domain-containing protein n=1 Tax=Variovorax sp. Root411 TaxID=1736530 RepID=UPI0039DF3E88
MARSWHKHWKAGKSERHAGYVLTRLEADVFPDLGRRPIATITALQLLAVAKKIDRAVAAERLDANEWR